MRTTFSDATTTGVFGGVGFGGQIVVEHDAQYPGDDEAFCAAYRAGDYAPDLHDTPW